MRILSIICIMFTICSCRNTNLKGELNYINLNDEIIVNVSCEDLKKNYSTNKIQLTDNEEEDLIRLFKSLKTTGKNWNIDARLFGFIYDNERKINFCMGNNIILINEKFYFVDDNLRKYIVKLTTNR